MESDDCLMSNYC